MRIRIPKKYVKPLDYFFILRPSLFFPIWIIVLAGYAAANLANGTIAWWNYGVNLKIFLNFLFLTLGAGGVFVWNEINDIETDKLNHKLLIISENHISPNIAQKISFILVGIAALYFLVTDFYLILISLVLVLFGGYLYNFKPFVWKNKPVLGVLTNTITGILLFAFGWRFQQDVDMTTLQYSIPYILVWTSIAILANIPDITGDKATDKITFPIKYGIKLSVALATIFVFFAFYYGMKHQDPVVTHAILLSIPLYVIALFKPELEWVLRTIRYSILFLAIFLAVEYPLFFIVLAINYYFSRFYYLHRFKIDYPSFHVNPEEAEQND